MASQGGVLKCKGTCRNLTLIFKKARHEIKQTSLEPSLTITPEVGKENLLQNVQIRSDQPVPIQPSLPPEWVDTYDKVMDDIKSIEQYRIFYTVIKMREAQNARLQITFGDSLTKEREINTLSQQITKVSSYTDSL